MRTPAFKKWFGDWETQAIRSLLGWEDVIDVETLRSMPIQTVNNIAAVNDKAELQELFRSFGNVKNKDGRSVRFPAKAAGKMIYKKRYARAFKQLFETSTKAFTEKETLFEGHKSHPNVKAYHHYVNKFANKDGVFYIRFTVREDHNGSNVHAAEVTDVAIYNENGATQFGNQTDGKLHSAEGKKPFVDNKLALFFADVNSVSKVVDENGEPLVVYHGTGADFTVFAHDKIGSNTKNKGIFGNGFYAIDQHHIAERYAKYNSPDGKVMPLFVNMRNPFRWSDPASVKIARKLGFPENRIKNGKLLPLVEEQQILNFTAKLKAAGYDGTIYTYPEGGSEYCAWSSTQIKSATDNVGTFDGGNADIRFSVVSLPYDTRARLDKPRKGWTEKTIKKVLKGGSLGGIRSAARLMSEFDSVEELKEHLFYHGTENSLTVLKPSIVQTEKWAEAHGGGGYGKRYWGISVSRSKKSASNFGGIHTSGVTIYPVILAKNAKVIFRSEWTDAIDVEEHIVELWNEGVDAVRLGDWTKEHSEQELCVLNPRAIAVAGAPDYYRVFQIGAKSNPINIKDDVQLETMLEVAKDYANYNVFDRFGKPMKPSAFERTADGSLGELKNEAVYAAERALYEADMAVWRESKEGRAAEAYERTVRNEIRFSVSLSAIPLEEAKEKIAAQKNKPFRNFFTDLEVTLSSRAEGKLVSKKAAMKSVKNGFTFEQHNAMAANVGDLFERGFEAVIRGDKEGDANIKSIRRYVCPVSFDDKKAFAWITVKESKQHGAKIYSVESIELEAFSRKVEEELLLAPHALNAPMPHIVPHGGTAAQEGRADVVDSVSDAEYLNAVKRGDMAQAQAMLEKAWKRNGYAEGRDHLDAHAAPYAPIELEDFKNIDALLEAREEGWDLNLWAIAKGISGQPDDFFSAQGPRLYGYDDKAGIETRQAIANAIDDIRSGRDDVKVKIYRAVPNSVKGEMLQSGGEWVSPSKTYAENHGKSRFGEGKYRIIEAEVKAEELWWDGNDAREWGYDDGHQYVYANERNGRKLATVTYDDNGNVIPLSQRFNPQNPDIRYSVSARPVSLANVPASMEAIRSPTSLDYPTRKGRRDEQRFASTIAQPDTEVKYSIGSGLPYGLTREEVEADLAADIQAKLEEIFPEEDAFLRPEVLGVRVHGSRMRGDHRPDSDLDVVLSYSGKVREDALFDLLNEDPLDYYGLAVDINPIHSDRLSLDEYMAQDALYDQAKQGEQRYSVKFRVNPNQMDLFQDWLPAAEAQRAAQNVLQRRGATDEERKSARERVSNRAVTARDFKDVFGFSYVNIGTFDQKQLDQLYLRMLDMCDVLDIPYQAIPLGGAVRTLNLRSIGSRTSGQYFRNSVALGFSEKKFSDEREIRVRHQDDPFGHAPWISFAHEWFHALDNILAYGKDKDFVFDTAAEAFGIFETQRASLPYDSASQGFTQRLQEFTNKYSPRPEIATRFDALMHAIYHSAWYRNMRRNVRRNKKYYLSDIEMAARLFETWIANQIAPGEIDRFRGLHEWQMAEIPTAEEVAELEPALKELFNALKVGENTHTRRPTLYSVTGANNAVSAQAQREYDAVVARYTNPDGTKKEGWLKAPNGKKSNLTERQWVQVRTPSFKNWFGDWENDPENASKVVDENGEPLVVYHGTANGGAFDAFDASHLSGSSLTSQLGAGFYFTNVKREAASYLSNISVLTGEMSRGRNPHLFEVFLNIKKPLENRQIYSPKNLKALYQGASDFFLNQEILTKLYNPFVPSFNVHNGVQYHSKEELSALGTDALLDIYIHRILNQRPEVILQDLVVAYGWRKQEDLLEAMKKFFDNRDGVIEETRPGLYQYVAWGSTQIKSATDNVGTFDGGNADIRYSVTARPASLASAPMTLEAVLSPTSLDYLTRKGHRDEQRFDYEYAQKMAQSKNAHERERGLYMLAKYHNDGASAAQTILRAFHVDSLEAFLKTPVVQALKRVLDTGYGPVVFVPVVNFEGEQHNMLPKMYARMLADVLGGDVYDGIHKTSVQANTGATAEDRMANVLAFGEEGDLSENARIILVDDVYTSGATLRQLFSYIAEKHPSAQVVSAVALAAGKYGKGFKPTEKSLQAVLDLATMTPKDFIQETGHGLDVYTEAELKRFLKHNGRGNRETVLARFRGPREWQNRRADDTQGALPLSRQAVGERYGGRNSISAFNRVVRFPSESQARIEAEAERLAEDVKRAQAKADAAKKRAADANLNYAISAQGASRLARGMRPEINDLASHPELKVIMSAIAMEKGYKVTPRDVKRFTSDFGIRINDHEAKAFAEEINEDLWSSKARAEKMKERAINRGSQRSPFDRSPGLAAIFEDIDDASKKEIRDQIALTRGVARGASTLQRLAKDAQEIARARAEEAMAQSGYSASTIEQTYGFDLVDTILAQLDAEAKMSKEEIALRAEKRVEAAEKRAAQTVEETVAGHEQMSTLTEEDLAVWREAMALLRDRTRAHALAEQERIERAKRKIAERKAEEGEQLFAPLSPTDYIIILAFDNKSGCFKN